ncbi:MAG TPA: TolC family protein [Polyangiaceae bacterium]|nr:TolC family protein [Polyangiaceae bacterium]
MPPTPRPLCHALAAAFAAALLLAGRPARALQPLESFVRAARAANPDAREARAESRRAGADAAVARAALLPSFVARGLYTRNQYEVAFALPTDGAPQRVVIQPQNQLDAFLTLTVPVVDLAGRARAGAAAEAAEAARADEAAAALGLEARVAAGYYRFVGAEATREAAARGLDVAERNARLVRDRLAVGAASDLDAARAEADAERARQDVADAELGVALAARALATLSGLEPEPGSSLRDEAGDEAPLEAWLRAAPGLPSARAAAAAERAAGEARRAAEWSLLPSLAVGAEQRFTNASSFVGRRAFYTLTASLTWSLDAAVGARVAAQEAAADAAAARAARARRAGADLIYEAWHRTRAALARARAARAQRAAAARAAELARDRYEAGSATQNEVIAAQRDAFAADVACVQADADLALARTQLRLSAGRTLAAAAPL